MRRALRIPIDLVLVALSTAMALYAVESVLAVRSPVSYATEWRCRRLGEPDKCIAAKAANLAFDTRTKLEVLRDLARSGADPVPSVAGPAVIDLTAADGGGALPFGGIARSDTVYCNESGEYVVYRSDEHGFRNPPGLYGEPPVAVVLGDSFARGYCVERDIASYLREGLGPALNLGIDDAGPLIELAALREIAAPLGPPFVLWLFFEGNDLIDLEREWEREPLQRYLAGGYRAGLFERQPEIDRRLGEFVARGAKRPAAGVPAAPAPSPVASFAALSRLRELFHGAAVVPRSRDYPFDAERLEAVLATAREATHAWGGELVFVYLPAWERFSEDGRANPHRDAILESVRDLGLPMVDVTEAFAAHPDPVSLFPFRMPGHYTQEGYRLVAAEVGNAISARRSASPR